MDIGMPKPSQRCTFGHSPTTKPKAIASLRGKLKRYLLVRKKIWYLVHALAAIDLFLFPLSASVCPIHHRGNRQAAHGSLYCGHSSTKADAGSLVPPIYVMKQTFSMAEQTCKNAAARDGAPSRKTVIHASDPLHGCRRAAPYSSPPRRSSVVSFRDRRPGHGLRPHGAQPGSPELSTPDERAKQRGF